MGAAKAPLFGPGVLALSVQGTDVRFAHVPWPASTKPVARKGGAECW